MSRKASVPLLCYWDGRISNDAHGITYENAVPKASCVSYKVSYDELIQKLYKVTGFSCQQVKLRITCRYMANGKYVALPIDDDDSVKVMTKEQGMNCVELYLEKEQVLVRNEGNEAPFVQVGHFTRLLTQENNIEDLDLLDILHNQVTPPELSFMNNQDMDDHREDACASTRKVSCTTIDNYACVVEGTDINNELVDDDIDEDPEEVIPNERSYKVSTVPEFRNVDWINEAVVGQWESWAGSSSLKNHDEELCVGQNFGTKRELQIAVKLYSLKFHQQYIVVESNPELLALKCKQGPKCPWKLRASVRQGCTYFEIKKYFGPHTCSHAIMNRDHKQLDSELIAYLVMNVVKAQVSITPAAIQAMIADKYKYDITYKKAWKAKVKAIEYIFGDWKDSYKLLPRYMDALQRHNAGTVVIWKTSDVPHLNQQTFQRVFWAFSPSIEGFKYCRPVISIDGTHLYGKYKGTMLIAMGVDANDQLFPLSFAIAEGKNNDSWGWFMACIREYVTQRKDLCIISDRHNGILNTMASPYLGWNEPNAHHRICIRHFASNLNSKFHDTALKKQLWKTATSNQVRKFNFNFERMIKVNPEVENWLNSTPREKWALAHDGGRRYGIMTTNMSEVFNSVLLGCRSLPITACVECTFERVNMYFAVRRQWAEERVLKGEMFPSKVNELLEKYAIKANTHEVILFDHVGGIFRIKTGRSVGSKKKGGHVQGVNIEERSCTCQKWQLSGIPCSHVIAACKFRSLDYRNLVEPWFSSSNYLKTWTPRFHPIHDESYWPPESGPIMVPDEGMRRTKKGRPQSKRLRNEMDVKEGRAQVTCSLCKQSGHNKRSCQKRNETTPHEA